MIRSGVIRKIKNIFSPAESEGSLYDFGKAEIHAGPLNDKLEREIKRTKRILEVKKQIEEIEEEA